MIKNVLTTIAVTLFCFSNYGQEESTNNKTGLGFGLTQHQNDFGIGVNMVSPYFGKHKLALRLRGNLMWNQHPTNNNRTTWTPYSNASLGLVSGGEISEHIRLYGEGGINTLFPSSKFSLDSFLIGGYGLFGFEFKISDRNNYFIELGGVSSGSAQKISRQPIYANGFLINVGYRFKL